MATQTTNYNLTKPDPTDEIDIEVLNENFDTIDEKIKDAADAVPDVATPSKAGIVKPDGTTIIADQDGTIHGAQTYVLPIASPTTLGGVRVGNNLNIDQNGILSATGGANYYTADAGCNWLEAVATYTDIATTYPSPSEGDTVLCEDTGRSYYYDGSGWILISVTNVPEYTYSETLAILNQ